MAARGINARLHRRGVECAARALTHADHVVQPATLRTYDLDIVYPGRTERVAVRVARAAKRKHVVSVRGQRYEYLYPEVAWNKHRHGRRVEGVDVWVLVLCERSGWRVFVVPARIHRGLTLSVNPHRLNGVVPGRQHWLCAYEVEVPG